jgi:4-diphosphocytidyl-2-C-methyl-D-erythritol kinase
MTAPDRPTDPVADRARAKINLCLHVTGQRADGYHLLDSLVVFAELGDEITAQPAAGLSLSVTGPEGAGLSVGDDNLVLRAARAMGGLGAALVLDKQLPVASGIGGGSADAAATLRVLSRLWGKPLPEADAVLALGADVPVCLAGRPCRMGGIGEVLQDLAMPAPAAHLLLVNPRVAVPTPAIFKALHQKINAPLPKSLPRLQGLAAWADFLSTTRNDLEPVAVALCPAIGTARALIAAQPGCLLSRMSGSGATCFGLFASKAEAQAAAAAVAMTQPGWWVRASAVAG